jgi:hypothetical protein
VCWFNLSAQNNPALQDISNDETAKYTAIGNIVSGKLLNSLKSELMIAIKESGAAAAIKMCNIKAIPLTEELINTDNSIKEIKRTSKKYRNPANSPDSLEMSALEYFENNLNKSENEFVQKFLLRDSTYYNYYQSIKVGLFCLKCHGTEEKMEKEILELIKKMYPEDKAKDYKIDDFRGVIKITFIE